MKKLLALAGGGALLYLIFRKPSDVLPAIEPSCQTTTPPTPHPLPPAGFRRATALPKGAAAMAQVALENTSTIGETFIVETFPDLLFFSEWHCSNGRWHRGVSVFEKVPGPGSRVLTEAPDGTQDPGPGTIP